MAAQAEQVEAPNYYKVPQIIRSKGAFSVVFSMIALLSLISLSAAVVGAYILFGENSPESAGVYASFASGLAAIVGLLFTTWSLSQSRLIAEVNQLEAQNMANWEWYNRIDYLSRKIYDILLGSLGDESQISADSERFNRAKEDIDPLIEELEEKASNPPGGFDRRRNNINVHVAEDIHSVVSSWEGITETDPSSTTITNDEELLDELMNLFDTVEDEKQAIYPQSEIDPKT